MHGRQRLVLTCMAALVAAMLVQMGAVTVSDVLNVIVSMGLVLGMVLLPFGALFILAGIPTLIVIAIVEALEPAPPRQASPTPPMPDSGPQPRSA